METMTNTEIRTIDIQTVKRRVLTRNQLKGFLPLNIWNVFKSKTVQEKYDRNDSSKSQKAQKYESEIFGPIMIVFFMALRVECVKYQHEEAFF